MQGVKYCQNRALLKVIAGSQGQSKQSVIYFQCWESRIFKTGCYILAMNRVKDSQNRKFYKDNVELIDETGSWILSMQAVKRRSYIITMQGVMDTHHSFVLSMQGAKDSQNIKLHIVNTWSQR